MNKFIQLTSKDGNTCYVNTNYIVCIEQTNSSSIVILNNDIVSTIEADESASYLYSLMDDTPNKTDW